MQRPRAIPYTEQEELLIRETLLANKSRYIADVMTILKPLFPDRNEGSFMAHLYLVSRKMKLSPPSAAKQTSRIVEEGKKVFKGQGRSGTVVSMPDAPTLPEPSINATLVKRVLAPTVVRGDTIADIFIGVLTEMHAEHKERAREYS